MTETLEKGTILQERYVINEVIGKGGFGITYCATDRRVDVTVAVKEYLPERNLSEKEAMLETKLAGKFYDLEGIAAARDCFVENERIYIVMEYVNGISVKKYVKKHGRMSGTETLERIRPIIMSLAKIHSEGVIHRDISADNLMITEDGKMILVDFGTARFTEENRNKPYTLIFKRGFAPIEQCRVYGKQGPWTDIYSLCATIYYMITGMVPDDAVERMIDDRLLSLEKMQGTGLNLEEARALMKGLEIQPEKRYSNVVDLYAALYKNEGDTTINQKEKTFKREVTMTDFRTTELLKEIREMNKQPKKKKRVITTILILIFICLGVVWKYMLPTELSMQPKEIVEQRTTVTASPNPFVTKVPEIQYTIGNYEGLTKRQVKNRTKVMRKAGLTILYQEKYSDEVTKGKVISQRPIKGKKYTKLQEVSLKLVISKGPKPTLAPTLVPIVTVAPTAKVTEQPKKEKIDFSGDLDNIP